MKPFAKRRGVAVLCALLVPVCTGAPALAGPSTGLGAAGDGAPLALVAQALPSEAGPLFDRIPTHVPGLELAITNPLAGTDVWNDLVAWRGEHGARPFDETPFARDARLDGREWRWYGLLGFGEHVTLHALAVGGRDAAGVTRTVVKMPAGTPAAHAAIARWRAVLLELIETNGWTDLARMDGEVTLYTILTDDPTVDERWDAIVWANERNCWADFGKISPRPDPARCDKCCDDNHDTCGGGCGWRGALAAVGTCALGAAGCLLTVAASPAVAACCSAGAVLGGGLTTGRCHLRCDAKRDVCKRGCP